MSAPQESRDTLLALIDGLCSGMLTRQQVQQLEQLLANDPAARQVYLEYFDLHTEIHWRTEMRRTVLPLPETAAPPPVPLTIAPLPDPSRSGWAAVRDYLTRTSGFSVVFALVAIVSLLLTSAQVHVRRVPPPASPLPQPHSAPAVLARLTQAIDCQWAAGSPDIAAGAALRQGKVLKLERGTVEIAFQEGTRVVLSGPARFQLAAPHRGRLLRGKLTALVAKATAEFAIETPRGTVVDLGTEFGVAVDARGDAEIHVFSGSVLVQPTNGSPPLVLAVGQATRLAKTPSPETSPTYSSQPERFLRTADLPEMVAAAAREGLERALIHRWTFNDDSALDHIGGLHGALHGSATIAQGRLLLNGVDGYLRASPLAKDLSEYSLVAWVAPANFEQQGGGVVILEKPRAQIFDGLVFAEIAPLVWINGSDYFRRTQQRPQFVVPEPMLPGETALLAITYESSGTITLYRNGERYGRLRGAQLERYDTAHSQVLMGLRHSKLAHQRGTARGRDAFFAGSVDEVHLYDRALSAEQIKILFEAGPVPATAAPPPSHP